MEWMVPSIISSICGTFVLILMYTYLYKKQASNYLGIWTLSWVLYFLRFCFMLPIVIGYESKIFTIGNHLSTLISGLLLILGLYIFLEKKFPTIYLYITGLNVIWIVLGVIYDFPLFLLTTPLFTFIGLIYLLTGFGFLKKAVTEDYYKFIGYLFIFWGVHKLDYPLLRPINWFAPLGYMIGAVLSFAVAISILLIYFEKMERDLNNNKNKLHTILDAIPDLLLILNKDNIILDYKVKDNIPLYTSPKDFIGKKATEVLPENIAQKIDIYIKEIIATHKIQTFEYQLLLNNTLYYFEARLILNKNDQILAIIRDISDKRTIEASLRESEAKYRSMMDAIEDLVFISSSNSIIEYANPAMIRKFEKNIVGHYCYDVMACTDMTCTDCIQNQSLHSNSNEVTLYNASTYHLLTSPLLHDDGSISKIHILRDISHLKKVESELRNTLENLKYLSYHDKLTDLYNRAFFEEELQRLTISKKLPLSLILIDVNGLKLTNDAFGHREGDKLLKTISKVLRDSCQNEDTIARIGGDEFAIILSQTNEKDASSICLKIKENCTRYDSKPVKLSISIGVATKTKLHEDMDKIFKKAEDIMYRNKLKEGKSIRNSIILSIQKMLRERSNETEEHGKRMEKLALLLGKKLRLTEKQMDELALLAILHDIGKIGIPDHILTKNGPLTDVEWETMKKHCEIGYHIVKSSPELGFIADAILSHHERWDGTGYPQGIQCENIPLISRIISIIDAYDVMTHDRPYSKAISHMEAVEELKKCSGTQFDAKIVEAFSKSVSKLLA